MQLVNPDVKVEVKKDMAVDTLEPVKEEYVPSDGFRVLKKEELITKGLLYPPYVKLEGRPLKVMEVKKLASISNSPDTADYVINDILKSAIRGINVQDLFVADKLYLLFLLRADTFNDTSYTVGFYCDKCNKESSYHFTVENLVANYIEEDYDPNKEYELANGDKVTFKYLQVRDENDKDAMISSPMVKKKELEIDKEILHIASSIRTINDKRLSLVEKYNYVSQVLSPFDFSDIVSYLETMEIGVNPLLQVTCKECGGVGEVPISFRSDFFFPKRKV